MNGLVKENGPRIRDGDDPNLPPPPQDQFQQYYTGYPPPKFKWLKIIGLILLITIIIIGLYIAVLCLPPVGGWRLESLHFTFDSEAELNCTLLDELYYDLDNDSRINVTNETYFLVLSIARLNYSIRFDYLFEFTSDNLTNLRIEQHSEVPKLTSYKRIFQFGNNLSIEFKINSSDPDILNVNIFPPDNIIYGNVLGFKDNSESLMFSLDEGEVIRESIDVGTSHHTFLLPHNHKITAIVEYYNTCPFR